MNKILFRIILAILCTVLYCTADAQKGSWLKKSDIVPLILTAAAGYTTGVRDHVIYHPNQLFKQHPGLNRNFWDVRVQNPPGFLNTEWDADHVFKTATGVFFIAAITLKGCNEPKVKQPWYKVVIGYFIDGLIYYATYKVGFTLGYNVTFGNKLF